MPDLSLTDLLDIVSAAGTPKLTKIKRIKSRGKYSPAKDFYRPFREHVQALHKNGGAKNAVKALLSNLSDAKKIRNYTELVDGYTKWWGKKTIKSFQAPRTTWTSHGVNVRINPELGLVVDGDKHLIKLYLKAEPLTKNRVDLITHLMSRTLKVSGGGIMSVLDVRQCRLISPTVPVPGLDAMLDAEAAYISTLWPKV